MGVSIYGDRVAQARTLRAVPSGVLAAELGWRPDKQTRAERSELVTITEHERDILVRRLRFSEFFFATPPPDRVDEKDLLFRAPKATTQREQRYLAEFARSVGEVLTVLDDNRRLPPVRLPRCVNMTPAEAASESRRFLSVGADEPIDHLTHKVERAGVPVIARLRGLSPDDEDIATDVGSTVTNERHYGYSTWLGAFRHQPLIVTRVVTSWERTRWTVAHELGHVCLHQHDLPTDAEAQASEFANELLAPHQQVAKELPMHVTLASLVDIKMRWGISIGALIRHLHRHDLITAERKRTLQRQIYTRHNPETGRTWGMDEPGWNARTPERPRLLSAWMEACLGAKNASAAAAVSGMIYPSDVLAEMMAGQRPAPKGRRTPRHEPDTARGQLAPVLNLARR
jgi:Zn-dependent peptidase ImmA (M78 family)